MVGSFNEAQGFCSEKCRNECEEHERMADEFEEPREDNFRDDVEADADVLASAGFGTDEDYGYFGEQDYECADEWVGYED